MLNDFKIYIANSFTCSSQTQVEIFNTIKEFYPFLIVENNNFRRSVRNYLISLEQKNQKQTINKKISALRKFQSYVQQASKSGEYSEIYFSIKYRKCFRLPKFYSLETINQINLLIHNLELSIFWKIILSLLTNHGAKISELQDIKFHHIDWLQGTINVSNRLFFLSNFEFNLIIEFLSNLSDCDYNYFYIYGNIFVREGRVVRKNMIYIFLKDFSSTIHIKINCRELRNTFIINQLNSGMPGIILMNYLGLKSIKSIDRFQNLTPKNIFEKRRIINSARGHFLTEQINKNKQLLNILELNNQTKKNSLKQNIH